MALFIRKKVLKETFQKNAVSRQYPSEIIVCVFPYLHVLHFRLIAEMPLLHRVYPTRQREGYRTLSLRIATPKPHIAEYDDVAEIPLHTKRLPN